MPLVHRVVPTVLFLLLLAAPSWTQTGMLRGAVVDEDGAPLPGVQVTVTSEQLPSYRKDLTTGKKGDFTLRFQTTHLQYQFEFLFEKSGYESFKVPLAPSATQKMRERWEMKRGELQVVESHGDLGAVVTGTTSEAIEAFNAGLTAQQAGDLTTARARFEEALAADADLGPGHIALAQVLLDLKHYDAAIAAADQALVLGTSRAEALQVKHQSLIGLGRKSDAEAVAAELVEADDATAAARLLYNEGGQAFQAGDRETAVAKFRQAATLDPSLVDAQHALATLELAGGNYEASAAAAEKALALGSDDVRTLRVLYDAYDALGRTEDLSEIAPRLAEVDPDFGGPKLLEQAAALWNAGEPAKAVSLSQLALSMDPTLAKAYYFIGLDHVSKGDGANAKMALQKFIDMAPDDPEVATAREMMSYIE